MPMTAAPFVLSWLFSPHTNMLIFSINYHRRFHIHIRALILSLLYSFFEPLLLRATLSYHDANIISRTDSMMRDAATPSGLAAVPPACKPSFIDISKNAPLFHAISLSPRAHSYIIALLPYPCLHFASYRHSLFPANR